MKISLIAAVSENQVIGKDNDLPWKLPDDMKYFMQTTTGHHVIMGRKNYDSLPTRFKPLPDRTNIILTRQKDFQAQGCLVVHDVDRAILIAEQAGESELFVIGGAEVYKELLKKADKLYLTEIKAHIKGDTYFPYFSKSEWQEISRKPHAADDKHLYAFDFVIYERNK